MYRRNNRNPQPVEYKTYENMPGYLHWNGRPVPRGIDRGIYQLLTSSLRLAYGPPNHNIRMEHQAPSATVRNPSKQDILKAGNDELRRFEALRNHELRQSKESRWLIKVLVLSFAVLMCAFLLDLAYQHYDSPPTGEPVTQSR